jgi:hypothetical protein
LLLIFESEFYLFAYADLIVVYMDDKIDDFKNICGNKKRATKLFLHNLTALII